MDKRTIILFVSLFILIVVGMFVFAYLKQSEIAETPTIVKPEEVATSLIERIDAKQYYIDGVHTFVGEIVLPTPCDLLEVDAVVMESMPEQIALNFTIINNSEMCAQVMTTQRFKVEATASKEAKVQATFMGAPVLLNLVPAAAGEVPEEFELFIKG